MDCDDGSAATGGQLPRVSFEFEYDGTGPIEGDTGDKQLSSPGTSAVEFYGELSSSEVSESMAAKWDSRRASDLLDDDATSEVTGSVRTDPVGFSNLDDGVLAWLEEEGIGSDECGVATDDMAPTRSNYDGAQGSHRSFGRAGDDGDNCCDTQPVQHSGYLAPTHASIQRHRQVAPVDARLPGSPTSRRVNESHLTRASHMTAGTGGSHTPHHSTREYRVVSLFGKTSVQKVAVSPHLIGAARGRWDRATPSKTEQSRVLDATALGDQEGSNTARLRKFLASTLPTGGENRHRSHPMGSSDPVARYADTQRIRANLKRRLSASFRRSGSTSARPAANAFASASRSVSPDRHSHPPADAEGSPEWSAADVTFSSSPFPTAGSTAMMMQPRTPHTILSREEGATVRQRASTLRDEAILAAVRQEFALDYDEDFDYEYLEPSEGVYMGEVGGSRLVGRETRGSSSRQEQWGKLHAAAPSASGRSTEYVTGTRPAGASPPELAAPHSPPLPSARRKLQFNHLQQHGATQQSASTPTPAAAPIRGSSARKLSARASIYDTSRMAGGSPLY